MIKKIVVSLWLLLLILGTSWALFRPGFFRVHDYVHAARIAEITRAVSEGHFPVRWSANFGYGYGMPLFEFYAPLPYYFGAFWYWLGADVILVLKSLWLVTSVVTIYGAYLLGRQLYGRTGGLVVAAAFGLAPYRALNLYVRGALSEAWGMMAMPWILLGILMTLKKQRWGWLILVAGLVTLFLSHNLTTLIFVPLSVLFAGAYWLITERSWSKWRSLLPVVGSYVLSIGLAAFYMVPAFLEKDFTQVARITGGYFDYSLHFLYLRQLVTPGWGYGGSGWGPNDDISFFLGFGQWVGLLALVVVMCLFLYKTLRFKGNREGIKTFFTHPKVQLVLLMVALLGVSLFMSIMRSQVVWQSVSLLTFIQFPWRWLSAGLMFASLAAGASLWFIKWKVLRAILAWKLILLVLLINWWYFQPQEYMSEPNSLYYTEADRIQSHMSDILNDYIPVQMPDPAEMTPPTSLFVTDPGAEENQVDTQLNRGHEKLFATNFDEPTTMTVSVAYFPGWQAEIDGQPQEVEVAENGLIEIEVPAGSHRVGLFWGSTPVRQVSDVISGVSFLILMYLLLSTVKPNALELRKHD